MKLTRRTAIKKCGVAALGTSGVAPQFSWAVDELPLKGLPIGFSTYGLPGIPIDEAIEMAQRVGYDALEICVTEDRGMSADQMKFTQRRDVRSLTKEYGLDITSLMEHLQPLSTPEHHKSDLERLKRTSNLAHDLFPEAPPVIQTVLGGKNWNTQREVLADRLANWVDIAESHEVVVAIKPHRGHAMSRPSEAAWLIGELGNPPRLQMWFDYSHFVLRDMAMNQLVQESLPITAGVAVKDAKRVDEKVRFVLPGEAGTIDYKQLFSMLYEGGYRAPICVEVSSQVWKQPNYDPLDAMNKSYVTISDALRRADIPRRH